MSVNGAAREVSGVSFGESQGEVNLTLVSPVTYGDTVTVAYAMPTGANANPIQSVAQRAASFAGVAVTNRTVSSLTPQNASVIGGSVDARIQFDWEPAAGHRQPAGTGSVSP